MRSDFPAGNLPQKRAFLPGLAWGTFRLLRMFWLVELALLLVCVVGLRSGWSSRRQWSDAYFYAAVAQFIIAGIAVAGSTSQSTSDAAYARYVVKSDISDTMEQLSRNFLHKMNFAMRAFMGGLLTLLVSGIFLWI